MKPSEQLRATLAMIEDPAHWTKYHYFEVEPRMTPSLAQGLGFDEVAKATCFCVNGAFSIVQYGRRPKLLRRFISHTALNDLLQSAGVITAEQDSASWNDRSTHEEVITGLRLAILYWEARGQ